VARSRLVLGLAAVFAGLTAVLTIAALVVQPFLLIVALPFAATTYFLWLHATGRLADRTRRAQTATSHESGDDSRRRRFTPGATDRGDADRRSRARETARGPAGRERRGRGAGRRAGDTRRGARTRTTPPVEQPTLSHEEACRILGVSPDADQDTVKAAYREQVKRTHPDTAAGDEQAFKRLNRAYERLKQG
jgi:DnaJ-domain-containing protein 1